MGELSGVRRFTDDLRAITPDSGVAAVLRTVAESARALFEVRFAAIVPTHGDHTDGLITVAVDGYRGLPAFDRTSDDGSLIRVPIEFEGTEFCMLNLVEPISGGEFPPQSIELLHDIAAIAGLAVQHTLYNEAHPEHAQWAAAFDVVANESRGPKRTALFEEIAQTAMRLSHTECAAVATVSGDQVEVRAAAGAHADRLRGRIVPSKLSLMGQVIASLKYDAVEDASTSERTYVPLSRAVDLGPAIVIPLQDDSGPIGSLLLGNHRGGDPVHAERVVEELNADPRLRLVLRMGNEERDDAAPLFSLRGTPSWDDRLQFLTRRELIVLGLLGEGLTNQAIADRLYLSEKTARNYVSNTLTKLGMRRVEAAVYAANLLSVLRSPVASG